MPIPENKIELIDAIETNYNKLVAEIESVPLGKVFEKSLDGHALYTKMSIHDLIAYLHGWGQLVLKWNEKIKVGDVVDFPETGYKWTELGLLAQKFYKDYENLPYAKLIADFDKTVNDLLDIIENKDDQELYSEAWYKHYPMGRMIQLNTSSPYKNALTRIRRWKKQSMIKNN